MGRYQEALFVRSYPELEEREAHDDGEESVDDRSDGAGKLGAHPPRALAEGRDMARQDQVHDDDDDSD